MRIQKEIENVERVKDKIATMPLTMEDAIEFHKQVVDRIEKERKEINKELDLDTDIEEKGFTGASKEPKKVSTPELKKMKLSESLFESLNESFINNEKQLAKYIANNFEEITGLNVKDIYNTESDEEIFNQDYVDITYPKIKQFIYDFNEDNDTNFDEEDILYLLDDELSSYKYFNESLNEDNDSKQEKIEQIKNEIMADEHDKLLDKMLWTIVPDRGKCDTLAGELVRAAARLVQRKDDIFYDSWGCTSLCAAAFLINNMPKKSGVPMMLIHMAMMSDYLKKKNKSKYPENIVNIADRVAEYIYNENPSLLVRPNKLDMLNDTKKYKETASKIFNKGFYKELYDESLNEELKYDDIQYMNDSERHDLFKEYHNGEDFEDEDDFWDWAEEEFPFEEMDDFDESLNECDKFKKGDCKNYALDEAKISRQNQRRKREANLQRKEAERKRAEEKRKKAEEEAKKRERIGDAAWSEKDWIAEREKGDLDFSNYSDEEKAEIEKRLKAFDEDPTAKAKYKRKKEEEARAKEEEKRKKAEQEKEEKIKQGIDTFGKVANASKDIGNAFKKGFKDSGINIG